MLTHIPGDYTLRKMSTRIFFSQTSFGLKLVHTSQENEQVNVIVAIGVFRELRFDRVLSLEDIDESPIYYERKLLILQWFP